MTMKIRQIDTNPVAKHAHKFNKAAVMADKKKAMKHGKQKHKKKDLQMAMESDSTATDALESLFESEAGKVWTVEEIRAKIQEDDKWLIRAMQAIYQRQTETERANRNTKVLNNIGFNAMDADFLSGMVAFYKDRGFFTPKQIQVIRRKMIKYAGQLTKIANRKI
jgi:hypothetical protein